MNNIRRIMLTVSYDGTAYNGWAEQTSTPNTIEGELNRAIERLTGEPVHVIGASRTDAGVHAYGNVAVFDTASSIPGDRFVFALNHELPQDIRIVNSREVATSFHPRHCDTEKTYEYRIFNSQIMDPTKRFYTCHFSMPLDIGRMNAAAHYLVGEHDFTSFCNVESQALSHVRTIKDIRVTRNGDEVVISVTGNGFLYNMVRIIAGTLMQIGRGKGTPAEVKDILDKKYRGAAGPTAPAEGLFLVEYKFLDGIPGPDTDCKSN
ncbi:tRNA pseudouridine synthase A TruA1 [Butyrivibrio proteoclasticus B316]|uniref:tRNA pseudouridine synthase A n=1 Tax=Butyrivibrio proteoclasticus (strain ATCC 51982 / DSM 14932 / B316) TaxID=515622 RepID=E0S0Q0_BUTPB|nr:tRNA pseudouridine(38-40) synthase TruA [Butyrivibrio proteoclasticus]ADL33375.1 tRNA pseudouridine synthase A TruA1 [Butyrivibrio proteoclasticus B316]